MDEKILKEMLSESQDMLLDLGEAINGQELRLAAILAALEETVPGFAQVFERAYAAEVAEQEKSDSEGTPSVRAMLEQIRKLRRT